MGGSKGDGDRSFSVMFSDGVKENRHKPKYWKCPLNINKSPFICRGEGMFEVRQTLEQVVQIGCGVAILGDIENLFGRSSDQPSAGDSALSRDFGVDHLQRSSHSHFVIFLMQLFTQLQPGCILFFGPL